MKKKALQFAIGLLIISNGAFAQWGGSTTTTGDIYRDGKVGIGTTTPIGPLHILNNTNISSITLEGNSAGWGSGIVFKNTGNLGKSFGIYSSPYGDWHFSDNDASTDRIFINRDGNVGIGTTNPGSFKLAVEGKIGAREIQVTLANPFPDYVFASNYKLRSLSSLENYINQNKHLPNVPSATEVEKNGGVELGQMNTKLLEKVEELTLYIIEINKKVEKLEKENEAMKKRLMKHKN